MDTIHPVGWREAPYVDQLMGLWAMREMAFRTLCQTLGAFDLSMHMAGSEPNKAREKAAGGVGEIVDGVALIEIRGSMAKQQVSAFSGTSTVAARQAVRAAATDESVKSIMLVVDSPGGTVAGTGELAADIGSAAQKKPVIALIEDMGASAAYWAVCQATQVYAQPAAMVGSIGTYGVVYDSSQAAADRGIKVHVVRAGQFKGTGVPGTEVTPEQLADLQSQIDAVNELFLQAVSSGRKLPMDKVRGIATGQVWIGRGAVASGLIDDVATFDQAFELAATGKTKSLRTRLGKPGTASFAELTAAVPYASAEFLCSQLKREATVDEAQRAWILSQNELIAKLARGRAQDLCELKLFAGKN